MRKPTISLRWLMALVMAGLVAISVAAAVAVEWLLARDITARMLSDRAVTFINTVERDVVRELDAVRNSVDRIADLLKSGAIDPAVTRAMERELTVALAVQPAITGMALMASDFGLVQAFRRPDRSIGTRIDRRASMHPDNGSVDMHASTQAQEGSFWGEVVASRILGEPVLNVRRRVERAGAQPVTIISGVTVGQLSRTAASLEGDEGITIFMIDDKDGVLIHPRATASARQAVASPGSVGSPDVDRILPGPLDVGDAVLARIEDGTRVDGFETAEAAGVMVRRVRTADQDVLVFVRPLAAFQEHGWQIGVHLPTAYLDSFLAPLRAGLWAGAALIALAVVVALVLSGFVARPVTRFTKVAGKIADLDLDHVPPLRSSSIHELAESADAFNRMITTLRAFGTYVPKSLVRRLIKSGSADAIHSHTRELAVMFTDIAGFTSLSESMEPGEVAALLNAHYSILAGCVEAEEGTVDKYLGDGMLAFWGAPDRVKDRALRACQAALAIRDAITADNRHREAAGLEPVRVRIGVHSGPLTVGNIGSPDRLNYTVVGDTVNVAQRLQDLGKTLPPQDCLVLVSDAVMAEIGDAFETEDRGELSVKGRAEPVRAFRLVGPAPAKPPLAQAALP